MLSEPDKAFAGRIAAFCLGTRTQTQAAEKLRFFGPGFTDWDGQDRFLDQFGRPSPLYRKEDGTIATAIVEMEYNRARSAIAEMDALGNRSPIRVDMHDARDYGLAKRGVSGTPVVGYNRRIGASNMVLWPLSSYHTIGAKQFVHATPIDPIPFEQKRDVACWRGNLTGRTNRALAPLDKKRRFAFRILKDLENAVTDEEIWRLHEEMMGITRYNLVRRYCLSKEINAALVFPKHHENVSKTALLEPLSKNRVGLDWFFQHKYILSLSGNDTGSNFLMAANSNSVVLKERDRWELFYTGEFRPWEHYIPLSVGALDVDEKLAWAKENPKACKDMVRAAQGVCARFASAEIRQAFLSEILHALGDQH